MVEEKETLFSDLGVSGDRRESERGWLCRARGGRGWLQT